MSEKDAYTSEPFSFQIQYRPNRETGTEGLRAKKIQQVTMSFVDSRDPSQYRVITMWKDEFNKMMNCQPATGFEGMPVKKNAIEPCPVGSSTRDPKRCAVIAEGKYTVGGTLASGNKSKKNPFVLAFTEPEGSRQKVLSFEMLRGQSSPDGKVRPITPTTCSYTKGIKIRS